MLMMTSVIGICAYYECVVINTLTCDLDNFPDISHVMGNRPYNKLYSLILVLYSAAKLTEARAYNHFIAEFTRPAWRMFLLFCAILSAIFGPCIGYWDVFYDVDTHVLVAGLFSLGEVFYVYGLVYLVATHP
jgi:hypothetical protein